MRTHVATWAQECEINLSAAFSGLRVAYYVVSVEDYALGPESATSTARRKVAIHGAQRAPLALHRDCQPEWHLHCESDSDLVSESGCQCADLDSR